jgi:hypothetical protein
MARRYYTVDEVDALLPRVTALLAQAALLRAQLRPIFQRLDAAGVAPRRSDFDVGGEGQALTPAQLTDRGAFKGLLETLNDTIAQVNTLGGELKDLDDGLVDWRARSGDQEVWLCWRMGEPKLGFWHPIDAGFNARRPISELGAPARPATTP